MTSLVYIAGPITYPEQLGNAHAAIKIAEDIYERTHHSIVPLIPHTNLLWQIVSPHAEVEYWYEYDLNLLARCDALFRIPGESVGADREVEFANKHNIPVFHSLGFLMLWHANQEARDALPA